MRHGRPLRFLGVVLGGWTTVRVAMLWPDAVPASLLPHALARTTASVLRPEDGPLAATTSVAPQPPVQSGTIGKRPVRLTHTNIAAVGIAETFALAPSGTTPAAPDASPQRAQDKFPTAPLPRANQSSHRLAGSTWLVVRQGTAGNLAFGQLGASQAGARLTYALDRHVALSGRLSAPLRGAGREAALGLDWQPTRWPVHLLAEQRLDIETARTRTAVQIIAGTAVALPLQVSLDAYAQAGAVAQRGGFVDGAVRLARVAADLGVARVEVGGGTWGGVQRGATRLDVGPSLGLAFPAKHRSVRLSLDYRVRVAGRANPGSGPALTLGSSF